jgi:hypothetical protein
MGTIQTVDWFRCRMETIRRGSTRAKPIPARLLGNEHGHTHRHCQIEPADAFGPDGEIGREFRSTVDVRFNKNVNFRLRRIADPGILPAQCLKQGSKRQTSTTNYIFARRERHRRFRRQ